MRGPEALGSLPPHPYNHLRVSCRCRCESIPPHKIVSFGCTNSRKRAPSHLHVLSPSSPRKTKNRPRKINDKTIPAVARCESIPPHRHKRMEDACASPSVATCTTCESKRERYRRRQVSIKRCQYECRSPHVSVNTETSADVSVSTLNTELSGCLTSV